MRWSRGCITCPDDPPELVAKKLLRVNLSDLAAKGARPLHYLLTTALPKAFGDDWVARFAAGLGRRSAAYSASICSAAIRSRPPGRPSLSLTAIGEVAAGRRNPPQRRARRRPGLGQRHDRRRLSRAEGVARRVSAARPGRARPAGRALSAARAAHRARAAPRRGRACDVRRVGRADRRSRPYLRGIGRGGDCRVGFRCRFPAPASRLAEQEPDLPARLATGRRRLRAAVYRAVRRQPPRSSVSRPS